MVSSKHGNDDILIKSCGISSTCGDVSYPFLCGISSTCDDWVDTFSFRSFRVCIVFLFFIMLVVGE